MNAVLDKPDVLDESILDAVLTCANCSGEAEWRWSMKCCGAEAHLCDTHDATGYRSASDALLRSCVGCSDCGKTLGYGLRFRDVYRRHEV